MYIHTRIVHTYMNMCNVCTCLVYLRVHTLAYMHACIHTYLRVYLGTCIHTSYMHTYIHTYIQTLQIHAHILMHLHLHMNMRSHGYMYVHTEVYVHGDLHIHKPISEPMKPSHVYMYMCITCMSCDVCLHTCRLGGGHALTVHLPGAFEGFSVIGFTWGRSARRCGYLPHPGCTYMKT